MRHEEAQRLSEYVLKVKEQQAETLKILNIGSSTAHFREVVQPHIKKMFIDPCENAGCVFINHDIKKGIGVDIVGDLLDQQVVVTLKNLEPDIVVASNILEHIERGQLDAFVDNLKSIVPQGKVIMVTVPFSYPIHFDPIDTYLRPSPTELVAFFEGFEVLESDVVLSGPYWTDYINSTAGERIKILVRLLCPFYKAKSWLSVAHRFLWMFRKYKVSFVVLKSQAGC